jgi:hypothetical protein
MGISLIMVNSVEKVSNRKKVCPIHIKCSHNGEYKRFPTKAFIEPKYWKEGEVSTRCPDYTNIQKIITSIINRVENNSLPIPPLFEQNQIVDYLDYKTKEIDDLVQLVQRKIDLLKEYRQSLISEVVTGKIKVTP